MITGTRKTEIPRQKLSPVPIYSLQMGPSQLEARTKVHELWHNQQQVTNTLITYFTCRMHSGLMLTLKLLNTTHHFTLLSVLKILCFYFPTYSAAENADTS